MPVMRAGNQAGPADGHDARAAARLHGKSPGLGEGCPPGQEVGVVPVAAKDRA
jgi:hypothetical protein